MNICGIDLGSRSVKLVLSSDDLASQLVREDWETEHSQVLEKLQLFKFDTIEFYRNYGRKQEDSLMVDFVGLGLPEIDQVVSTGYGRNTLSIMGGKTIPEIKAHVLGAIFQTGRKDFTLLDLGGQDSKIIKVRQGKMVDFLTNDKCAASSGRYLENMAAVLGISLEEMGQHWQEPVELSSTCAVFGESELIGKIVEGYPIAQLAAGVNYTIYKRIQPLLRQHRSELIIFAGGVAKSAAIREIIAQELKVEVIVPRFPQYNGAIGCWEECS
jgi:predicted CoA-substrate-specific enzyme activase